MKKKTVYAKNFAGSIEAIKLNIVILEEITKGFLKISINS